MIAGWAGDLPDGWTLSRGEGGTPLDERGTVRLVGPPGLVPDDVLVRRLTTALEGVRAEVDAALADAAAVADGERDLATGLGGESVWRRVAAEAGAGADRSGDPYAVVVLVADEPGNPERWLQRAAAALRRSVREVDVVTRSADGFTVLAPRCTEPEALADRLAAALLEAGVGVIACSKVGPDPLRARAEAHAATAGVDREIWRL